MNPMGFGMMYGMKPPMFAIPGMPFPQQSLEDASYGYLNPQKKKKKKEK
jgi:hypothetical protein